MNKLAWLFPTYSNFGMQPFESQLSTVFVTILGIITVYFLSTSSASFFRACKRVRWLDTNLAGITPSTLSAKREDLYADAKSQIDNVGHLWLEFDETLIEVRKNEKTYLYNTYDAAYFFNSTTLAKGITDNRLIAAVPGFLTAIGVIGTFMGLQIGLSEMNISASVSIDEMKAGVSAVIGGAKVAFMTSVWGVFLSVAFNFAEKTLEQSIRKKIDRLQHCIDELFPRLSPEAQLQVIADNSSESRDSLQGLAEQIGLKMQESMMAATTGISSALEESLNKIMAPAINKLVDDTSDGNQKALEDLLTKFMDGFGAQGQQQRQAMENASVQVNDSIAGMNTTMESFIRKMEQSQSESGKREEELISSISLQVSQLVEQGNAQTIKMNELMGNQQNSLNTSFERGQKQAAQREEEFTRNIELQLKGLTEGVASQSKVLTDFANQQIDSLQETFNAREVRSAQLAEERDFALSKQTDEMASTTQELIKQVDTSIKNQQASAEHILQQGKSLQQSVESSIMASAKATDSMRESASELRSAADSMNVFSSHIRDAGNQLSGAVTEAAETTSDLAIQNQASAQSMESLRAEILNETAKFNDIVDKVSAMIRTAGDTFTELKSSQREYLDSLKGNVSDLSKQMTNLLTEYAEQANSQTANHLDIWARSSTQYAESMNNAVRALSNVVDEIQDKVGA